MELIGQEKKMTVKEVAMENKRNFKGIWIPREIWLSQELTLQEKVFLVEIDSLDNDRGCFASNKHFSDFFGLTKGRCSQIIKSLEDKGYTKISYTYRNNSKEIKERVIRVGVKYPKGGVKYPKGGYLKNAQDNNTSLNNTYNNIPTPEQKREEERFLVFYQNYPRKVGKKKARASFKKALKDGETLDSILSKLKAYEKQIERDKTEEKYIKHPASFLGCLEDFEEDKPTEKKEDPKCPKCGAVLSALFCEHCMIQFNSKLEEL